MTVNAISTIPAPMPLQDMQTLAVAIAKSNLFGIKTPEQALVLMAIAQAEGRHPVEAARDYDIINGRPAKKAEAMLRDFILAGGKVAWHALTDELADATFTHPQTGEVRIDWDMKRAKTAFGQEGHVRQIPQANAAQSGGVRGRPHALAIGDERHVRPGGAGRHHRQRDAAHRLHDRGGAAHRRPQGAERYASR